MNSGDPIKQLLACLLLAALIIGCPSSPSSDRGADGAADGPLAGVAVPHGYMARLEQMLDGRLIGFGPFAGYYFRPVDPSDLSRLRFVCFNENRFYSSDMADGARLYEGVAVRVTLQEVDFDIPHENRINPVFFPEAPPEWRDSRPAPGDLFLHFHSCYDGAGPVRTGYWLSHEAVADFTYDMGGRVGPDSPLYHMVRKGPDDRFARIIEFDRGPGNRGGGNDG